MVDDGVAAAAPVEGMTSVLPAMSRFGLERWFAAASAATATWYLEAMADSVWPRAITTIVPPLVDGAPAEVPLPLVPAPAREPAPAPALPGTVSTSPA